MKYLIFSDAHGDKEAIKKAIEIGRQNNVDKQVSLGDNIDYGLFPDENECLDLLVKEGGILVKSNHGLLVGIYSKADSEIEISPENLKMVENLEDVLVLDDKYLISHSGLSKKFLKIKTPEDAKQEFIHIAQNYPDIVGQFVGHKHTPSLFVLNSNGEIESRDPVGKYTLDGQRFIANPGPCTIKRTAEPKVIIFDTETKELEYVPINVTD